MCVHLRRRRPPWVRPVTNQESLFLVHAAILLPRGRRLTIVHKGPVYTTLLSEHPPAGPPTDLLSSPVVRLALRGVECVFGIPGVQTTELYRGLASSGIRHVTPRHEQGAGVMADGYARVLGKPGVAFVINGPGLTKTLSAMAQARADIRACRASAGLRRLSL